MSELSVFRARLTKAALSIAAGSAILSYPGESIPLENGLEMLGDKLELSSLVGATAVNWSECPVGANTKILDSDMRAWGYVYPVMPQRFEENDKLHATLQIDNVHSYLNEQGKTVAWCGSVTKVVPEEFSGPSLGVTVVLPRKNLNCDPYPPVGKTLPLDCIYEGFGFDSTPAASKTPLNPSPRPAGR